MLTELTLKDILSFFEGIQMTFARSEKIDLNRIHFEAGLILALTWKINFLILLASQNIFELQIYFEETPFKRNYCS